MRPAANPLNFKPTLERWGLMLAAAVAWGSAGALLLVGCSRKWEEAGALVVVMAASAAAAGLLATHRAFACRSRAAADAGRQADELAVRARELEFRLQLATAERQHAEAILYSISDAVLVTDPSDDLVLANDSAARTFAFDPTRAVHAPIEQALGDPRVVALIRDVRRAGRGLGRRVVEHEVETPQGRRTFKITLAAVPGKPSAAADGVAADSSGTAATSAEVVGGPPNDGCDGGSGAASAGVVVVLHDVTREKAVSEMKNEFVSLVSHELRTPLASIKAYAEMLIDGEAVDDQTKREFYDVIQNEANRLGRLIDNVLSLSRIESGLVTADRRPEDLASIVREALDVVGPQAAQKQVRVVDRLADGGLRVSLDRDMIYQAVLNLLGNAVKFTPEGGTVTVEAFVDPAGGSGVCQEMADGAARKAVVRVADTGVGIAPKDLPFVFDKFYRPDGNSRRPGGGSGLGLSLARQIVEALHGGRMFVESQLGRGSAFGFEVDVCEGE